jgi:hypothetical protein
MLSIEKIRIAAESIERNPSIRRSATDAGINNSNRYVFFLDNLACKKIGCGRKVRRTLRRTDRPCICNILLRNIDAITSRAHKQKP